MLKNKASSWISQLHKKVGLKVSKQRYGLEPLIKSYFFMFLVIWELRKKNLSIHFSSIWDN